MQPLEAATEGRHPYPPRECPRNPSWPVIGDSFAYLRHADTYLRGLHARYGEVVRANSFGTRVHYLFGPDANQLVLQNRGDLFASARWGYFLGPFFDRGLMLLDFDEHRMHRRIMQAAFTRDALTGYLARMQRQIAAELKTWQPGECLMFDRLKLMTLNIGTEVFVGQSAGDEADELNAAFLAVVQAPTGVVRFALPGTRWRAGVSARSTLEAFFVRAVAAKRACPGADLLSRLCSATTEDGELFSDEDVVNHMIFVLMAAHDTSTITLSNMLYQLAKHPEWQDRLREQSRTLGNMEPSIDELEKLLDMDLVMKETLRVCPPVPIMPRGVLRDFEFRGVTVRAGSMVAISPWLTHYLPEFWPDPERFDPERFAPGRAEDRKHPFQWVPFGGGAHKCIGLHFGTMEIKAILHRLLLNFRVGVPKGYVMKQDFTSLPIPADRLPVTLERLH